MLMRLIDADALEQAAIERHKSGLLTKSEAETVADMALNAPTIDPVKHGRWISVDDDEPWLKECSECETLVDNPETGWDYCPSCGAKMDGGEE